MKIKKHLVKLIHKSFSEKNSFIYYYFWTNNEILFVLVPENLPIALKLCRPGYKCVLQDDKRSVYLKYKEKFIVRMSSKNITSDLLSVGSIFPFLSWSKFGKV